MLVVKQIDLPKIIALSQWERIILTLITTCLLPLFVHALPFFSGANVGQQWLPIFYAPLIAALCFRPHVSLLAALCAPTINHFLFGIPPESMARLLTFELVVFNTIVILLQRRALFKCWQIIPAYLVTLFFALLMLGPVPVPGIGNALLRSLTVSWPGLIALTLLAEIARRFFSSENA